MDDLKIKFNDGTESTIDINKMHNSSESELSALLCVPVAWINEKGCTMSNEKYEETKANKTWSWIIEKHWKTAKPLYTAQQIMDADDIEKAFYDASKNFGW